MSKKKYSLKKRKYKSRIRLKKYKTRKINKKKRNRRKLKDRRKLKGGASSQTVAEKFMRDVSESKEYIMQSLICGESQVLVYSKLNGCTEENCTFCRDLYLSSYPKIKRKLDFETEIEILNRFFNDLTGEIVTIGCSEVQRVLFLMECMQIEPYKITILCRSNWNVNVNIEYIEELCDVAKKSGECYLIVIRGKDMFLTKEKSFPRITALEIGQILEQGFIFTKQTIEGLNHHDIYKIEPKIQTSGANTLTLIGEMERLLKKKNKQPNNVLENEMNKILKLFDGGGSVVNSAEYTPEVTVRRVSVVSFDTPEVTTEIKDFTIILQENEEYSCITRIECVDGVKIKFTYNNGTTESPLYTLREYSNGIGQDEYIFNSLHSIEDAITKLSGDVQSFFRGHVALDIEIEVPDTVPESTVKSGIVGKQITVNPRKQSKLVVNIMDLIKSLKTFPKKYFSHMLDFFGKRNKNKQVVDKTLRLYLLFYIGYFKSFEIVVGNDRIV